jgi:gamma-glutamyltranspeptidase/glutathione hydrolase
MIRAACVAVLSLLAAQPAMAADDLGAGGRPVGENWSRSPVYAQNGMAATAHPLASQVAVDILKKGGSAVDAAIAANAALGLMEPTGNGIGGDLFAIVWDPETEKLYGYNGSGRSPMGRSYDELIEKLNGAEGLPPFGALPVTVPGAVDGWFALHERFGTLEMKDNLAPAIAYAEEGFPVSPVIAEYFRMNLARFEEDGLRQQIEEFDNARATYFGDGAPRAGEIFRNPDLAETYSMLAKDGRKAFYEGKIARTMDRYMKRIGGDLRYRDFAEHEGGWVEPACVSYRGAELCELPPNGQGFAALQMLNIMKNADVAAMDRAGPEFYHLLTEAKRLAFADLARYYADPETSAFPTELLSDAYGQERYALIDPDKPLETPAPGGPFESEGDTTYLTVADRNGMMVSLIQSNYRGMGSGLVPDGLGFMLQDRGQLFSLDPDHPNVYAPGKRPFHTIIPAFAMKDGKPWISFGLMGGAMQPQGHVQIMLNVIDFGMNLQEAGDAARMNHSGGRQPTGRLGDTPEGPGRLSVEPGVPAETVEALRAMGHNVQVIDNGIIFGGYQAIMRRENGVYVGATEMRKDGTVAGY